MALYSPGDIVWRTGTIGAQREPCSGPVVVLASNDDEMIGGQPLYTCLPVTSRPQARAGSVTFSAGTKLPKFANLCRMLIAGESTISAAPDGSGPLLGRLAPEELSGIREAANSLLVPGGGVLGKIVYSATPAHDGSRGKPHRPYALIGEIGKGTGNYIAVPISSAPSPCGNGSRIGDLNSAGLARSEGEDSHTRFSWTAVVSERTASRTAGRLSSDDRGRLYSQYADYKQMLVRGTIKAVDNPNPGQIHGAPATMFPRGMQKSPAPRRGAEPVLSERLGKEP